MEMDVLQKRIKIMEGSGGEGDGGQGSGKQMTEMESQDMEEHFQRIFENVERYTHQVPHCLPRLNADQTTSLSLSLSGLYWKVEELLEAGRMLFKNLSPEFEERLISIHMQQIEKWQEEIKDLQSRHAANEAAAALLGNAHHLLRSSPQFTIHSANILKDSEVKSFNSKPGMFAYNAKCSST